MSGLGAAPRIVVLGGGTGLSNLLRGLKAYTDQLTAVVTVADDGGSSGRLRRELGVIPPGDIRNCLVALATDESLMSQLFQYRFEEGNLGGHCFGNLFLAALTKVTDSFEAAIKLTERVLATRGQVLPASLDLISLKAELDNGSLITGQSLIAHSSGSCRRVWIEPETARATPATLEAIAAADIIVIGPGSLFTSIIPIFMIAEIRQAVARAVCPRVFVSNVVAQPGETRGFSAADHLAALLDHTQPDLVDYVIANTGAPAQPVDEFGLANAPQPVALDAERLAAMGVAVIAADVSCAEDSFHHDSHKLALTIMSLLDACNCPSPPL